MPSRAVFWKEILAVVLSCAMALPALAADEMPLGKMPPEMRRWVHETNANRGEQQLRARATYYSNEYIEALVNSEAEKNLWTQDEVERYKYTLMKTLNLHDSIAFHLSLYVEGMPMYAQPFDKHISLMIGNKRYTPSDYDKKFNFKISGPRDGMVLFPRYDPKTGKDLLKGAKDIRLIFDSSISMALSGKDILWVWDITKDKASAFQDSQAMNRLEIDRLLKRLDKLNGDRKALQDQLDTLDAERNQVNSRIDELQAQ